MKTIPILFSTAMVQALLEGRKTQTRRIVKPRFSNTDLVMRDDKYGNRLVELQNDVPEPVRKENPDGTFSTIHHVRAFSELKCPYGQPGDILWVRESCRKYLKPDEYGYADTANPVLEYRADNPGDLLMVDGDGFSEFNKDGTEKLIPWKPSIHMPKTACRLFLKVVSVRVERLQDISEADAVAEGVLAEILGDGDDALHGWKMYEHPVDGLCQSARGSYASLWRTINGPESLEANPWVWVVEFEKCEKPENF